MSRKGDTGGGGLVLAEKSLSSTNGPGKQSSHLTGPPCSVQVRFTSWSWLTLPKTLDHKMCSKQLSAIDRVQSYVQPGAGKPICIGFGYQLNV